MSIHSPDSLTVTGTAGRQKQKGDPLFSKAVSTRRACFFEKPI
jgi:hypothetical protein